LEEVENSKIQHLYHRAEIVRSTHLLYQGTKPTTILFFQFSWQVMMVNCHKRLNPWIKHTISIFRYNLGQCHAVINTNIKYEVPQNSLVFFSRES